MSNKSLSLDKESSSSSLGNLSRVEQINRNRRSLRERIRDSTVNIIPNITNTVSTSFNNVIVSSSSESPSRKSRSVESENIKSSISESKMDDYGKDESIGTDSSSSGSINNKKIYPTHTASNSDTLTSIAARYDCTPSELIKLNKLTGRLIFPGQVIRVPHQSKEEEVFVDDNKHNTTRKFIKINVRHITDGNGVVCGTLLVTPNAVMFDPNVSDPLVIEQGAETYGVILPLEIIVHAGIFSDIAAMKVQRGINYDLQLPKPILYPHTKTNLPIQESSKKEKVLKRLSFPLTWMESLTSKEGEVSHKSAPPTASHDKKRDSKSFTDDDNSLKKSFEKLVFGDSSPTKTTTTTICHPLESESVEDRNIPAKTCVDQSEAPIRNEEEELTWYLCLSTGRPKEWSVKPPRSLGLIVSYGQKNHVRPEYWFHIVTKEQVDELYKFWMVWWPHLYSNNVDIQLIESRGYELIEWDTMDLFSASSNPVSMQCDAAKVNEFTKESWEMLKSPYTKLSSLLNRSQTLLTSTSSSATNFGQGILDSISDFASLDYNNEEVVSMSEELRQALYGASYSSNDELPELIGTSEILNDQDIKNLNKHLTARADGYPWSLIFQSSRDGFSLSTLYRRNGQFLTSIEDETPILLVIEDTNSNVFGALVSTSLRPSDTFYGTGQSFLFNLKPDPFRIYKWTGENMYFIKGAHDGIAIGAGDGKFGIWLDGDLNCGRTDSCSTYGNPPLVESNDFVIKTLECWAFFHSSCQPTAITMATQQQQQPIEKLEDNNEELIDE